MADFKWQGNSAEIFDTLIKLPPRPFRSLVKKSMTKTLINQVGLGGEVLPQHVIDAVRKNTPSRFVEAALSNVVGMYSCSAKCEGCRDTCPLLTH